MNPIKVVDAEMSFGGKMDLLLPPYNTLPEQFRNETDPFCRLVSKWFFEGIKKNTLKVKQGIDEKDAWRHMQAIMSSWDPKHEHKIAGVAYLMSQWFDVV